MEEEILWKLRRALLGVAWVAEDEEKTRCYGTAAAAAATGASAAAAVKIRTRESSRRRLEYLCTIVTLQSPMQLCKRYKIYALEFDRAEQIVSGEKARK